MTGSQNVQYLGMDLQLNERERENGPYFQYCSQGEFRLQRCDGCGLLRYPPSPSCPWCACPRSEWMPVEGKGTVYSYMEVHQAVQPAFRPYAPFLILLVELDTQRGTPTPDEALRVIGNLVDAHGRLVPAADSKVGIGSRVRMVFTPVADGLALPQWICDDAQAQERDAWRYPE